MSPERLVMIPFVALMLILLLAVSRQSHGQLIFALALLAPYLIYVVFAAIRKRM